MKTIIALNETRIFPTDVSRLIHSFIDRDMRLPELFEWAISEVKILIKANPKHFIKWNSTPIEELFDLEGFSLNEIFLFDLFIDKIFDSMRVSVDNGTRFHVAFHTLSDGRYMVCYSPKGDDVEYLDIIDMEHIYSMRS